MAPTTGDTVGRGLEAAGAPRPDDVEARHARAEIRTRLFGADAATDTGGEVGRYALRRRLGAGGMGTVFAAFDPRLRREIALKVLRADPRVGDPQSGLRHRREAEALAKLSHPNVVQVFEVGEHEGRVFIAMELVDGEPLGLWQQRTRPTVHETLDMYEQVGAGLAAAHEHGLTHRDFKPDNVMVGSDGRPRIVDFGLARAVADPVAEEPTPRSPSTSGPTPGGLGDRITATGAVLGTAAYMAPEQHRGEAASAASDQFSFCVALYEALYGERPFRGTTRPQLAVATEEGRVAQPRRETNVPLWLRRVVVRGLAPAQSDRFPDVRTLWAAIESGRRRGRRRRLALAGAAVLTVVTASTLALGGSPCAGVGDRLDEVYNGAIAADLRRNGLNWSRVEASLDAFSVQWQRERLAACEADQRRAAPSGVAQCLERQLVRVEALIGVLRERDPEGASAATREVVRLVGPRTCHGNDDAPEPTDEAQVARIAAARDDLTRAQAWLDTGRYVRADALAAEVAAVELGVAELEINATMIQASAARNLGDYERAARLFEQAFFSATAAGDEAVAANASVEMLDVVGVRLRRYDDALGTWLGHAQAHVQRGDTRRTKLEYTWGLLLSDAGQPDAGLEHLVRARELAGDDDTVDDALRMSIVDAIGSSYLNRGELLEALPFYEEALAFGEAALGKDDQALVSPLSNMSVVLAQTGRPDQAIAMLERALEITANVDRSSERSGMLLVNLGRSLYRAGRQAEARDRYEEALAAFERRGQGLAVAHRGLARIDAEAQRFEDAERHAREAVQILEEMGHDPRLLSELIGDLAEFLEGQGRFDEAEPLFLRSIEVLAENLGPDHPTVVRQELRLAKVEFRRGHYDRARDRTERGLANLESTVGHDHPDVTVALVLLANIEMTQDRFEDAEARYLAALKVLETTVGPDHANVAQVLLGLGNASNRLGRTTQARVALTRAIRIIERTSGPDHPDVGRLLNSLGMTLRKENKLAEAIETHRRGIAILEARLGPDHVDTSYNLHNLGIALLNRGDLRGAERNVRHAIATRDAAQMEPALRGDSYWLLARVLWKARKRDEARAAAQQAHDLYGSAGASFGEDQRKIERWLARR